MPTSPSSRSPAELAALADQQFAEGRTDAAVANYRQALEARPHWPEVLNNLGNALLAMGRMDEALAAYDRALERSPGQHQIHNNLGSARRLQGRLDLAAEAFRRAVSLEPEYAVGHNNLGNVLKARGELREAERCYRRAIELDPSYADAHSNLLALLNYLPGLDPGTIVEEHLRWAQRHGRVPVASHHDNDRTVPRRLRVGYLSGDLREHPVARLLEPAWRCHDREAFTLFVYANLRAPDEVTAHLRSLVPHWRAVAGLSDTALATRIERDRIDILVDLAGHTMDNRLLALAHRPAPVQATWLGYPHTTGLDAIGYRLTDAVVEPPEDEAPTGPERIVRLAGGLGCYWPPDAASPVNVVPATRRGLVTFGSLNNPAKINDEVITLWAQVLETVPRSRMLFYRHTLRGRGRLRLLEAFEQHGIARDRICVFNALPAGTHHMNVYDDIDVALDPFPWTGHVTTCEALWMGVPVVTLRGRTPAGRLAASALHQAGHPEWVAATPADYVRLAATLATDLDALQEVRRTLRDRVAASALCDGPGFTRHLEAAFRQMWEEAGR